MFSRSIIRVLVILLDGQRNRVSSYINKGGGPGEGGTCLLFFLPLEEWLMTVEWYGNGHESEYAEKGGLRIYGATLSEARRLKNAFFFVSGCMYTLTTCIVVVPRC